MIPQKLRAQFEVAVFGWHDLTARVIESGLATWSGEPAL